MSATRLSGLRNRIEALGRNAEILGVQMLGETVSYEDSDECKWVDDGKGGKECKPVTGKNCPTGRHCISYSITFKDGGVTKTKFFCECSSV